MKFKQPSQAALLSLAGSLLLIAGGANALYAGESHTKDKVAEQTELTSHQQKFFSSLRKESQEMFMKMNNEDREKSMKVAKEINDPNEAVKIIYRQNHLSDQQKEFYERLDKEGKKQFMEMDHHYRKEAMEMSARGPAKPDEAVEHYYKKFKK